MTRTTYKPLNEIGNHKCIINLESQCLEQLFKIVSLIYTGGNWAQNTGVAFPSSNSYQVTVFLFPSIFQKHFKLTEKLKVWYNKYK